MTTPAIESCPAGTATKALPLFVPAGHILPPLAEGQAGWRLLDGAMRTDVAHDAAAAAGTSTLVRMDLPGDLVGLDLAVQGAPRCRHSALVHSRLEALPAPATGPDWNRLLWYLMARQQRRCAEMARLRTGPVAERVRQLLLLLAGPGEEPASGLRQLPSLRDIGDIVGTVPETVSRTLTHMRHLRLIEDRRPGAGRYEPARLAAHQVPRRGAARIADVALSDPAIDLAPVH